MSVLIIMSLTLGFSLLKGLKPRAGMRFVGIFQSIETFLLVRGSFLSKNIESQPGFDRTS